MGESNRYPDYCNCHTGHFPLEILPADVIHMMSLMEDFRLPTVLSNVLSDPRIVFDFSAAATDSYASSNATTNGTSDHSTVDGSDHGSSGGHGGGHGVHGPEVLSAVFVLFIASITKYVHGFWGRSFFIPYSVLVILIGVAMAFGTFSLTDDNAVIGNLFTSAINIKGDVAFLLFLPLLLFLPAYHIPLHSFRVLWKQILITALLGRALDIFFVAFASTILIATEGGSESWDVILGLVFSSIVTTTDTGEMESALRASGCDKSVVAIMTTTSLIGNFMSFIWHDLLTHAMDAYSTKSLTALGVFTNFVLGFVAAPAFGLVWGMALSYTMSRIYNYWMSEVLIVVSVPYLTSWFAYELFGVSGMTSVIVLGLWMNYKNASISVKVQEFLNQ
ncbi:hypothetical protein RvY_13437 [Ramazzottius varieornatus]|uniref:Cation/H+ exchanger transmembrane domain-containing protein n=1 Tax=Ramazzottius varieornatus TaxID=947166 RepID=A0A1D1VMW3_RAMVA|nr:hypothetical protein RvY_13437 [Ramazzottius varieornatus]